MRPFTLPTLLCCCSLAASASAAEVQIFAANKAATKTDAIVEAQPFVASVAAERVTAAQRVARSTDRVAAAERAAAIQSISRSTTTFAAVTPTASASTKSSAPITPAAAAKKQFTYTDPAGQRSSAEIVRGYLPTQLASPLAKIDPKIDPKLRRAATIAEERARASTRRRCWRYVKEALLASGAIDSYPKTVNAKEAGDELVRSYGFKRLPIRDPYAAPVGSVLVYYKGRNRPGHVELRTKDGFASDFRSKTPDRHALLGVYAKRG